MFGGRGRNVSTRQRSCEASGSGRTNSMSNGGSLLGNNCRYGACYPMAMGEVICEILHPRPDVAYRGCLSVDGLVGKGAAAA
jgi:hypothetical protein